VPDAVNNNSDWTIELTCETSDGAIRLPVASELILGRIDPERTTPELVDLTSFGAADYGVSRRHAAIHWQGPQLYIYDLGSDNGTILNGTQLEPNVDYQLKDGDKFFLGHLGISVRLNIDYGPTSIRARRIDFDPQSAPMMGHGQRVLLVEDDVPLSELYKVTLERAGFTVQVCRDVVSAMRILNQNTPTLILLDIMLPGVHGLELCRYIRRDVDAPMIPIIVASALNDAETVKLAIDTGVDVYMSKPINVKELARVVGSVIHKQEVENPTLQTKQLRGTAALDYIAGAPRNDTIIIFVEGHREPIGAVVSPQLTLGRQGGGTNNRTYVDLESHGAFDKGVSRNHARIKHTDTQFVIEDLGSSNGTFINGRGLKPGEIHPLKNGDEVRLGELRMHIYLLVDTGASPNV
jgi:pSer/pThr/pTyr-binding forkhead associated (FHA) protein/CheY-like chemotaxis protein